MKDPKERNLYLTLYPLFKSVQFVGLSPLEYVEDNVRSFSLTSFKALRIMLNLACMLVYMTCTIIGVMVSFQGLNRKIGIGDLIEAGYGVYGTVIPICIICLLLRKRFEFAQFFGEMGNFRETLKEFIDCCYTEKILKRMVAFYWFTGIFSLFLAGIKGWRGGMGTVNGWVDFCQWGTPGMIIAVCIQVYITLLNLLASGFVEVLCSTLALTIVCIIEAIQKNMTEAVAMNENPKVVGSIEKIEYVPANTETKKGPSDMLAFMNAVQVHPVQDQLSFTWQDGTKTNYFDPIRPTSLNFGGEDSESNCYIVIRSLKQLQVVSSMQTLINDIFGAIIAINSALMVFLCCVVLYTYIKTKVVVLGMGAEWKDRTWLDTMDFWANSFVAEFMFCRLVLVFLSLGNIHNASVRFNAAVSKSLLSLRNPSSSELNLILASVTMNSINPISFSAGGYFVFSRASLLATASIIATYLIFLLQA